MRIEISDLYKIFISNPQICTDSRKSEPGSIFFALKGENFDGNEYAAQALENGCSYAVVDNPAFAEKENYLLADDVLAVLQELANHHRKSLQIPVLALTGSNGKTTTKELIKHLLSARFLVHATHGNLNNQIGVPLTLLNIKMHDEISVVEMGANHMGEIGQLCRIVEPDYGMITNIGKAHLEGFGSLEGVRRAKAELYDYLDDHGGVVFYNSGNKLLAEMLENFRGGIFPYGEGAGSCCRGRILEADPYIKLELQMDESAANLLTIQTKIAGDYNLENILAAVAVARHFKVSDREIISALSSYESGNNRSELIRTLTNTLVLDAYNANPTSMFASIENFRQSTGKNKLVIAGEMMELGDESLPEHRKLVNYLAGLNDIKVILVGRVFDKIDIPSSFLVFGQTEELGRWIRTNPVLDSTILLKGSRLLGLERLREFL